MLNISVLERESKKKKKNISEAPISFLQVCLSTCFWFWSIIRWPTIKPLIYSYIVKKTISQRFKNVNQYATALLISTRKKKKKGKKTKPTNPLTKYISAPKKKPLTPHQSFGNSLRTWSSSAPWTSAPIITRPAKLTHIIVRVPWAAERMESAILCYKRTAASISFEMSTLLLFWKTNKETKNNRHAFSKNQLQSNPSFRSV